MDAVDTHLAMAPTLAHIRVRTRIDSRTVMNQYCVQVTSPQPNQYEPGKPIYWHFLQPALSAAEALRLIQNSPHCHGLPARVVPRLG
jgi:hypothetical protein